MKMIDFFKIICVASVFCCSVISCNDDSEGKILAVTVLEAKSVNNVMQITFKEDEPLQLTPFILPQNAANQKLTYTNVRPDLMEVSPSGLLTAKGFGTDTLTICATDGSGVSVRYVVNILESFFNYQAFIGNYTMTFGGTRWAEETPPTWETQNVSIEQDVAGESYILKGFAESEYTIRLKYHGTGYGFQLTDNSNGGYPSQAAYFAYGVSFRTYTATNTATANGTKINIGFSTSDKALYYNMRFEKK